MLSLARVGGIAWISLVLCGSLAAQSPRDELRRYLGNLPTAGAVPADVQARITDLYVVPTIAAGDAKDLKTALELRTELQSRLSGGSPQLQNPVIQAVNTAAARNLSRPVADVAMLQFATLLSESASPLSKTTFTQMLSSQDAAVRFLAANGLVSMMAHQTQPQLTGVDVRILSEAARKETSSPTVERIYRTLIRGRNNALSVNRPTDAAACDTAIVETLLSRAAVYEARDSEAALADRTAAMELLGILNRAGTPDSTRAALRSGFKRLFTAVAESYTQHSDNLRREYRFNLLLLLLDLERVGLSMAGIGTDAAANPGLGRQAMQEFNATPGKPNTEIALEKWIGNDGLLTKPPFAEQ